MAGSLQSGTLQIEEREREENAVLAPAAPEAGARTELRQQWVLRSERLGGRETGSTGATDSSYIQNKHRPELGVDPIFEAGGCDFRD